MQRFERILFVNDTDTNAAPGFRRAVRLAAVNGAQLTVIDIGQELPRTLSNLQKAFNKVHEERLHALSIIAGNEGVETKTRVVTGTAFIEVIQEVFKGGHDLKTISDVLSLFILIELSRSLVDYFDSNRLRMTFIVDAGIVFVLRELMIKLFQDKLSVDHIYALSVLLLVLGLLRVGSVLVYEREKVVFGAASGQASENKNVT